MNLYGLTSTYPSLVDQFKNDVVEQWSRCGKTKNHTTISKSQYKSIKTSINPWKDNYGISQKCTKTLEYTNDEKIEHLVEFSNKNMIKECEKFKNKQLKSMYHITGQKSSFLIENESI